MNASLFALGASLTPLTVIENVWSALVSTPPLAVPPSSSRWIVRLAVPFLFSAGLNDRSPAAFTDGCVENRAVLSLAVMTNVTSWLLSFAAPSEMFWAQPKTVWSGASSADVGSASPGTVVFVNDGASLTLSTVTVNDWLGLLSSPPFAVPPLSRTRMSIVAVPLASSAGPIGQRAVAVHGWPAREQCFVGVRGDLERDRLSALVRRAGRDVWSPSRSTVCVPGSSSTSWSGPPMNDGSSLTSSTVIVNVLTRCVVAAIGRAAVVHGLDRDGRRAAGVRRQDVRQRAVGRDVGLARRR